ncbi:exodeoxyribonuclease VII large subunit [Clostridium septicum]|uniref:Exodeoxyribonuclease 7 large subunit n=1 Tax=Clostridium septicum TaxID=1504 RepID=A0A9N7JPR3_CLOSE|nr:exodeoxyribonuclease VII large subunit [Clostridium septicum]AYE35647.1 exodeoxyribonuclease VII large subunit [Clostridium septicum]MDU1313244.1 exodeoxyribonuclease VII large subunit [Clostridium septicum]QAS61034.1 exodeoxyribonuclease VII large subunit [Clostridium septicum]UEC19688.1 exodeoxyribonuclease VII large subunit [Clostridium septicum]USS02251.1 exodeoxyribonuclease VII large subunit [Clostridium septicum]
MKIKTLSVSEVNNYIKKTLDNDFILNNLSVKGEISNLKYHTSGHIYFSLKDSNGKLNCIMFRNRAIDLHFELEEGMEVTVKCRCSIYPGNGSLQLYIEDIEKDGVGELYIKFEKLKEKLLKEGYFDEEYKKPMPSMPLRVGVITSETGAVIKDIINVTRRRNKMIDIVLFPANVQGIDAYKSIIKGLKFFNNKKNVDVIILGRGGGSLEELWNFNEEELAIEIFKSNIPVVSAVGHEVDYTISDFVSDLRAATPSQAAEIVVPIESEIKNSLNNIKNRLDELIEINILQEKNRMKNLSKILNLNSPISRVANSYLEVDTLKNRLNQSIVNKINNEKIRIESLNNILKAHNPINVLQKGYSIVEDNEGNILSSKDDLMEEKEISMLFKNGSVTGIFAPIK